MDRENVDTDAIIPKQFLKSIKRTGYGENLFDAWRFLDIGQPGMDHSKRPLNPDFVLNQARYKGAQILLARKNFGCGSSREHAPWALLDDGFRCVIAPSFGDIHYANEIQNGMLPAILRRPEGWLRLHYEFIAWSYVGLVAAAVSESAVRLPSAPFWPAVAAGSPATSARSGRFTRKISASGMCSASPKNSPH